jgi:hypothetical protein
MKITTISKSKSKPGKMQPPKTFLEVRAHGYFESGRNFIRESFPKANEYILEGELAMEPDINAETPCLIEGSILIPFTAHYRLGRPRFAKKGGA